MQKEQSYLVELKQSEIEGIISALDSVVKAHGLNVAEKCAEIHNQLLKAQPKVEQAPQPPVVQQPAQAAVQQPVAPKQQVEVVKPKPVEEVSLEEVEEELGQIMEVPKKRKKTTRKKK